LLAKTFPVPQVEFETAINAFYNDWTLSLSSYRLKNMIGIFGGKLKYVMIYGISPVSPYGGLN
jgi:hypothetical protein